jgi:hypothetical protein
MSDETTTKQRERRDTATRTKDTFGDIQEGFGDIQQALSRRDISWITPAVAESFRAHLRRFTNAITMIDNTLDEIAPAGLRGLSIRVGGEIPSAPSGMLAEALAAEEISPDKD